MPKFSDDGRTLTYYFNASGPIEVSFVLAVHTVIAGHLAKCLAACWKIGHATKATVVIGELCTA